MRPEEPANCDAKLAESEDLRFLIKTANLIDSATSLQSKLPVTFVNLVAFLPVSNGSAKKLQNRLSPTIQVLSFVRFQQLTMGSFVQKTECSYNMLAPMLSNILRVLFWAAYSATSLFGSPPPSVAFRFVMHP